ncbi:VIT1/CCC1 transporter family protein [Terracidiphilus gabretensis]|uniref:VIT1/CCC1 transporter family protein n=1 Tax=Terracidiphilus gabretensis TaxID=1577687 RepID=UPI00071B9FFF|nr:VIT1/CCC1 transporter family protein [Terracidiphilus gabretensis]
MATEELTGVRLKKVLEALEANWQAEMSGYHTYKTIADRDTDPIRAQVLRHLAAAELEHAALWQQRIKQLGGPEPVYKGGPGGDAGSLRSAIGGIPLSLRRLEIDESRHIANYGTQLKQLGDEASIEILHHVIEDEKQHHRELGSLLRGHHGRSVIGAHKVDPKAVLEEMLAKRNKGRKQTGSWIGDAIYGVNDGLGAIFGIVSSVSGATTGESKYVLLAGLSGMIASALSMGSGAYLAAKSTREIYQAEVAREREAILMNPAEARELLGLYYQVKGLPEEDALHVADHIGSDPEQMVRALVSERIGSSEEALSKPMVSALSGALSTAVGAIIPVIPFFFLSGVTAIIVAAIISLIAHFAVGAAKSLITVRSWWSSGLEMTLVGAIEGAVTYGIGILLGTTGGL